MPVKGKSRVLIAALLLLCAGCDGDESQPQGDSPPAHCTTSLEGVLCTLSEAHLNGSGPTRLEVSAGQRLLIIMQSLPGDPVCSWSRGADPKRWGYSMAIPQTPVSDSGEYTFSCERGGINSSLTLSLLVRPLRLPTKPQLKYIPGKKGFLPDFQCSSEGNPKPKIKWFNNLDKTGKGSDGTDIPSTNKERANNTEKSTNYYRTTVMCCASNSEGEACSQLYDYDLDRVSGKDDEAPEITVSLGQPLLLSCRQKKDSATQWLTDNQEPIPKYRFTYKEIYVTYLFIESVRVNHSGIYTCWSNKNKMKSTHVQVLEKGFISIDQLNESSTISAQEKPGFCLRALVSSHPLLRCHWLGPDSRQTQCPEPTRLWKNRTLELCNTEPGEYQLHLEAGELNLTKSLSLCVAGTSTLSILQNGDIITCETNTPLPFNLTWRSCSLTNDSCQSESSAWKEIPAPPPELSDSDQFCHKRVLSSLDSTGVGDFVKCCITNSVHLQSHCSETLFNIQPSSQLLKVSSLVLLLALMLVSVALLYFIRKKKPQYQSQVQMIQMVGPNDNDYIYINFKDFQYDQKWEFPRENLELGKELGSGAFGMVVQATAYGISKPGVSLQVAVKMLKEKHEAVEKEALMSELKMLTHIGQHANIVNLLGACTGSGPTYLIFQYCCNGDLLNYLKNNRELYHKSLTDAFTRDRFSRLYHNLPKRSSRLGGGMGEFQRPVDSMYVPMSPTTTRGQESIALISLNSSPMSTSDGPGIYEELEKLQEEEEEEEEALTYNDLLSFSYQVAKGMDFLSSKHCIHRDLAARNVLVTQGGLVKIGDFGLARDIDNDSNYVVRGNVRLPVKWMAPESIFQGMYTMQSDVWAYGILLWEVFSLGVTPYPGIKVDNNFYVMIERGFKMEQPYYASESVYMTMCKCWALEPQDRPHFSKLVAFMDDQLADMEEKLYHNILDKSCNHALYQNALVKYDLSALAKENSLQTQSQNQYCKTHSTGEAPTTTTTTLSDMDAMETDDDDKPLKPRQ
ncbi:receptor-type tyrosine-protein kinase FLT3 isoform X1 [Coregonus clupeaformis]|uniref:receptor-type tyrosine-protein kinase FLT3 isoform X1 n=1 Tax=Coregonus clupeaformis TaxID=59861 RepID=UPI001BE10765|nr:receptor-type tyrosine-protein kinase FLT3 isoform X1 [Coregonus clupeaformis]